MASGLTGAGLRVFISMGRQMVLAFAGSILLRALGSNASQYVNLHGIER